MTQSLAARDRTRTAELQRSLESLELDGACGIDRVFTELRDLLDAETLSLYSIREHDSGLALGRMHHAGKHVRVGTLLERALRSASPSTMVFYDVLRPAANQRNRLIEATAWVDREVPGTWASSRMCREVLQPVGLHRHKQVRILLCEGAALLGWFGMLQTDEPTRRQVKILSAVSITLRRRLRLEERLASAPRTLGALTAALERLGSAAFVIGPRGVIHESNSSGRAVLNDVHADVRDALDEALAQGRSTTRIDLVPLNDRGLGAHYLAIVRCDPIEQRIARCVATCGSRWALTPRQGQVLELLVRGMANASIAAALATGLRAVELHVTALLDHAGVDSRAALVARVLLSADTVSAGISPSGNRRVAG